MNSLALTSPCREEAEAWLRLTLVPGLAPSSQWKLLSAFGTPQGVLAAAPLQLGQVVDAEGAKALRAGPDGALLASTLRWLEAAGHHLLVPGDPHYPRALLETHVPPVAIYAIGRVELLNVTAIAIVGSRNATPLGRQDAHAFARALSDAGLAIVSGLALGIDAQAHHGGLAGPGSSIAVMGTGADIFYPKENSKLAGELATRGCIVTEFPLGTPPLAGNFPRRNRLISGLARGVLVVEAAERSGSLITARYALDQDRDVFAMPGSIHSPLAKGCHRLIKDGAKLVECANDVLLEWGLDALANGSPQERASTSDPVLAIMGFEPVTADQMAERTGKGAAAIGAELSRLQIEGRIAAIAGGWFQRLERET